MNHTLIALACLIGAAAPGSAAPLYTIVDLGALPGGDFSTGNAINAAGQVAGDSAGPDPAHYVSRDGVLFSAGSAIDLGSLGAVVGRQTIARSINAAGQIAGSSLLASRNSRAFLWSAGTLFDLGVVPGAVGSDAYGINANGVITGSSFFGGPPERAFVYSGGAMHDIGTLAGPSAFSRGTGINDAGDVTGFSGTSGHVRAFLYQGGAMYDIGTLGGDSYGNAINASGQITGYSQLGAGGPAHVFFYSNFTMHDFGTLTGGDCYGNGLNDAGTVVGQCLASSGSFVGVMSSGGGLVDLNTLIDPLSGWQIALAGGINNAGQIAGTGVFGAVTHAIRLDPIIDTPTGGVPEPASWALLLTGFAITGSALRRRRSGAVSA